MKLMYFDDYKLGVVTGDAVVDVSSVVKDIPHTGPHREMGKGNPGGQHQAGVIRPDRYSVTPH
jgi:hypothetical protein